MVNWTLGEKSIGIAMGIPRIGNLGGAITVSGEVNLKDSGELN